MTFIPFLKIDSLETGKCATVIAQFCGFLFISQINRNKRLTISIKNSYLTLQNSSFLFNLILPDPHPTLLTTNKFLVTIVF